MLICIYANSSVAQNNCTLTVDVSVVELHTAAAVYPVVVYVDELDMSFETNENGKFQMAELCAGKYTFHFHAIGYEHHVEQVDVLASTSLRFKVAHTDGQLEQVVVSDDRVNTILQANDKLGEKDIEASSGLPLSNMLQQINGVNTISNGATIAKPVIHGLHSNRIVLLNNGIRQEDQQWGSEHAPNIDPFLAKNIKVIKGAASVRYGTDAIGGVVLVEPAPLPNISGIWNVEFNLAGMSNNRMGVGSAMVEHNVTKIKGLSFRLQGTYKKGGNYRIPNYWVANTGVEEKNYSAAIGLKRAHYGVEVFYSRFETDLGIYRGAFTGNANDLNAAIASDTPLVPASFTYALDRPRQHVEHDMFKVKTNIESSIGIWHLTYAYQHNFRQEYDVLRIDNGKAQLNLTLNTQTVNLNLDHKPIGSLQGQIGIDGIYQENFIQAGDRVFIPNYKSTGAAAYIIERKKWNSLLLEAGLRYDYRKYDLYNPEGSNQQVVHYQFDYNSVSATLGITKNVNDKLSISSILSNAWRAPQANELFSAGMSHGGARVELGDKTLKPERSYNLNIETEYKPNEQWQAIVSLYTQYISNYIYLEPGGELLTIRGLFQVFNYKQTNAQLSGVDVSINHLLTFKSGQLNSGLKASFLHARNVTQKDWLIQMPSDRIQVHTKYTQNLGNGVFKTAFIGVAAKYVFQQVRIPSNFDQIDYPRPPSAYFLLDGSIGTDLQVGKQPISISITGMNMLNTKYRDYMDAFRYFVDQPGTNVVLRINMPLSFNNNQKQ